MDIIYDIARSDDHLKDILALQQINLPHNISESEKESQGFVTVEHDFQLLKKMNNPWHHIIALDNEKLIGYALVMLAELREDIDILIPMFNEIDQAVKAHGNAFRYFVMGQVCISKPYRGKGVFKGLYQHMRKCMQDHFDCVITEVDPLNKRSLRAHYKTGFRKLKSYMDSNKRPWELIIWDWN
ncbi:MAG: GNAT family N-acetyltransferase [Saprospiraceae bacterium]|nr:GNAT family N-acetyltransferase [Bacteroidia bacterium]MBT8228818.1 GNAT family N-acetyltransferase [Bacteroidia bacterium]NNF22366.1 GNAT family N-acetyltransferase [Saprospiraceae bacterium]NNK89893.1 GNAT family N-acetyltransferase [Saprospiraceae bacterium]